MMRSVIFNAESVKAILAGQKTETRRVVRPQPPTDNLGVGTSMFSKPDWEWRTLTDDGNVAVNMFKYPYGWPAVGGRAYVRETWGYSATLPHYAQSTRDDVYWFAYPHLRGHRADNPPGNWCWKSPLYMPRWASRIEIEITSVGVERLQDIKDDGICAEGMTDRDQFAAAWDALNARRGFSWSANPYVWVLKFKMIVTEEQ